jgi:hypothetical protein
MRHSLFLALALFALHAMPFAQAQDAASAKTFLTGLFHTYENKGKGPGSGPKVLHSSLIALMNKEEKLANKAGDIPTFGDGDFFWVINMDVQLKSPQLAEATVEFSVYPPKTRNSHDIKKVVYTLAPENGGWRIYDMLDLPEPGSKNNYPSARHELEENIKLYTNPPKK